MVPTPTTTPFLGPGALGDTSVGGFMGGPGGRFVGGAGATGADAGGGAVATGAGAVGCAGGAAASLASCVHDKQ